MQDYIDTAVNTTALAARTDITAYRWLLGGRVQSVGYRPFVFRTAQAFGICGYVKNHSGEVVVIGEGESSALRKFGHALLHEFPPLARPLLLSCSEQAVKGWRSFRIVASTSDSRGEVHLPPDCFCCEDCLKELNDPGDRRFRFPFINCTQCGPRYTLIARLPYDRCNTSMAGFDLCSACRAEYLDPASRRFHAEPLGCEKCGPQLEFHLPAMPVLNDAEAALGACIEQLLAGRIVAVKGVGGYHLLVDATNDDAVARLRVRKHRPHKPVAVLFPEEDRERWLERSVILHDAETAALYSPVRPIVLATLREQSGLAAAIAPGLKEVGVMLPYSPLHHLLLQGVGKPLVATSANLSGEPVLTKAGEVERRLAGVADCFLHHDRDIIRPADDSVVKVIAGKARPIRCGRGIAPLELNLPFTLRQPVLATGSQTKNTIALGWGNRSIVSPHIGDLDSPHAVDVFEQIIEDLQALYGIAARAVTCDAHTGFAATRWAGASGLPVLKVLHHHAHASALAGEYPEVKAWLTFTWDGIGIGGDGGLWGGEGFVGSPGHWRRAATLRAFRLPGGESAARAPWRSAAGLCWETQDKAQAWRAEQCGLLYEAWRRGLNSPYTSAVGRLFDAAAALVGLLDDASYEGQGPMSLEAAADGDADPILLPVAKNSTGLWQIDWAPLIPLLTDAHLSIGHRAAVFHASLAHALLAQSRAVRRETGILHVGLCGGVFQNARLAAQAMALLRQDGFEAYLPERLPCNDAALSFGQLIETGASR